MNLFERITKLEKAVRQLTARTFISYAKGSWVPTLIGLTTAGALTYDATNTKAEWTRIGNRIWFQGRIRFTVIGTPLVGTVVITGLPVAAVTTGFNVAGGAAFPAWTLDLPAGFTQVGGFVPDGGTNLQLERTGDNVAPTAVAGGEVVLVAGVSNFFFEGQYRVA